MLKLMLALALASGFAWTPMATAQIYICKDAGGRTLTADRPIAECADRAMRELDRNGNVRREIAAPLTPQQKQERAVRAEQQRVIAAAQHEQQLYDQALITRYRTEGDVSSARTWAINLLNDQRHLDTTALQREMGEMKAAQAGVGAKPTATNERRRLSEASNAVAARLSAIEHRSAEIERVNAKFDLAARRLRELQSAAKTSDGQEPTR
jgi:hypothetical protein